MKDDQTRALLNLVDGETVLFEDRRASILFASSLAVGIILSLVTALIALPLIIPILIVGYFRHKRTWLVVTNRRVIITKGRIFGTDIEEIPLRKVETVTLKTGILGNGFSGVVTLTGAGNYSATVKGFEDPMSFRRIVAERVAA